jgi:hypothetical protein
MFAVSSSFFVLKFDDGWPLRKREREREREAAASGKRVGEP